jgi:hypothetical protein
MHSLLPKCSYWESRSRHRMLINASTCMCNLPSHFLINVISSVSAVVPRDAVMRQALEWASTIISNSPDAVRSTKKALLLAKENGMWDSSREHFASQEHQSSMRSDNIKVTHLAWELQVWSLIFFWHRRV